MNGKTVISGDSSVVVRQFMEFVRGEVPVHQPRNEFRTVAVTTEERYCLRCFVQAADFDVWEGVQDGLIFRLGRCRICGAEVTL